LKIFFSAKLKKALEYKNNIPMFTSANP